MYQIERVVEPGACESVNAEAYDYDLAIVGSGGGAFAAAIAARRRDLRVVIVEHGTIGGTCVNVGCIPSKALLAAAEACHRADHRRFHGITTQAGSVDFAALIAGKREIVETMRQEKYIDLAARDPDARRASARELAHLHHGSLRTPQRHADGRSGSRPSRPSSQVAASPRQALG